MFIMSTFTIYCKYSVLHYTSQSPPHGYTGRTFIDPNFPDGSIVNAKNYCRNPDGSGLHCYTSGNVRGDCAPNIEPCKSWSKIIIIVIMIKMKTTSMMSVLTIIITTNYEFIKYISYMHT